MGKRNTIKKRYVVGTASFNEGILRRSIIREGERRTRGLNCLFLFIIKNIYDNEV